MKLLLDANLSWRMTAVLESISLLVCMWTGLLLYPSRHQILKFGTMQRNMN